MGAQFTETFGQIKHGLISCSTTTAQTLVNAIIAGAATGPSTDPSKPTWPGAPANSIPVLSYVLVAAAPVTVRFFSGSTAISGPLPLGANGGIAAPHNPAAQFFAQAGSALKIKLSSAVVVGGHYTYLVPRTANQ